jgi:hypothetical protein
VINTNDVDNEPLSHIVTSVPQERVASIGTTLVGLGRSSRGTSSRPPRHRGSTVDRSISGSSMNRNTYAGPVHASGSRMTRQNSSKGSRGSKQPLEATVVRPFYMGPTLGGSSRPATSRGPDVDEDPNVVIGINKNLLWTIRVGIICISFPLSVLITSYV